MRFALMQNYYKVVSRPNDEALQNASQTRQATDVCMDTDTDSRDQAHLSFFRRLGQQTTRNHG